jgi:XTP/dITP diphosphohydrolase
MDIYLASGNAHKVQEFNTLLSTVDSRISSKVRILSAAEVGGMPKVVEDAGSFLGNARKKAVALAELLPPGGWALSDDSGLSVDALKGAPGVESAYYAGPQGDSAANLRKLMGAMAGVDEAHRGANFSCVLCLATKGREPLFFRGRCDGRIAFQAAGKGGFGYDPVFIPDGFAQSFAELGEEQKNKLSHRAKAWSQLSAWLLRIYG